MNYLNAFRSRQKSCSRAKCASFKKHGIKPRFRDEKSAISIGRISFALFRNHSVNFRSKVARHLFKAVFSRFYYSLDSVNPFEKLEFLLKTSNWYHVKCTFSSFQCDHWDGHFYASISFRMGGLCKSTVECCQQNVKTIKATISNNYFALSKWELDTHNGISLSLAKIAHT